MRRGDEPRRAHDEGSTIFRVKSITRVHLSAFFKEIAIPRASHRDVRQAFSGSLEELSKGCRNLNRKEMPNSLN